MSPLRSLPLLVLLACLSATGLRAQSVLFVGNSFTFKPKVAGVGIVSDLNGKSPGTGVPAAFQALAAAAGKNPIVSMETVGGKNLAFHYTKRRALIDQSWDIVVLQDHSVGPLVEKGNTQSRDSFHANLGNLRDLLTARNPAVKIWLYETWARPDYVKKGRFPSMESMQADLHQAYSQAARDFSLQGWVPVGDAFLSAVRDGLADNPVTPAAEGPLKIWDKDNHHQSTLGAYLAALLFYGKIYDADPRALPADNAAAARLHISPEDSRRLQALAWDQLHAAAPPVTASRR